MAASDLATGGAITGMKGQVAINVSRSGLVQGEKWVARSGLGGNSAGVDTPA